MQIVFTADIHIKLGQKNVPVLWAKSRYRTFIAQLQEIQRDADMLIIGGDIFDKMPSMEELEIYYELVSSCVIPTLIYPGNHESVKKDTTFFTHLKSVTNLLNKKVTVIDEYYTHFSYKDGGPGTPVFNVIPYNRLKEFEKNPVQFNADILFTHVRGAIEPFVKPEINLDVLDSWKVVLAGDLHSYENSQRNILYPGSPLTTSFHRNTVDTGIILFDTDRLTHTWVKLSLPQLLRKTINAGDPMVATDYHHTIFEIEGDMAELSGMEDNALIDKKVVKRNTDTTLILDPSMSLQEEVREYLLYVLNLEEATVDEAIHVLNNNMSKLDD